MFVGGWVCGGVQAADDISMKVRRVTARGGRAGHCTWRDMPSEARCGLHNASLYKKWAGEEAEMVLFSFLIHTPMINKSVQKKVMNICHVCTNYLYYLKQTTSLKTCFVFVFWQLSLNLSSYRSH